jgi:hypothetical protein
MARRLFKRSKTNAASQDTGATPRAKPRRNSPKQSAWYNRLSLILLLLTPIVFVCYLLIFTIPSLPLNPFPPQAQAAIATFAPTLTPQPTYTRTPTPTHTNTPTNTPRPTLTPTITNTPRPTLDLRSTGTKITSTPRGFVPPTRTSTPTITPTAGPTQSPFKYTAEVLYQTAQLYGTNWSGIAGLVFGLDLKHQAGIGVKAWGDDPLGPAGQLLPSGTATQYGPSGFEFTLGDKPISGTYYVQLLGSNGELLSPAVEIDLKGDPRANLAYIIFRQNH